MYEKVAIMIVKSPTFSFLPDLQMPLRDALRGVASLADATEDMLEPATRLLPEPLRSRFRHALESLEAAGKRLIHAPIDTNQINTASRFLTASGTDKNAIASCASVFVFAWEHLNTAGVDHRHLISETIIADRLGRTREASSATGVDFAAAILADLRTSSAIGRMPGLARGIKAGEESRVDLALGAIAVWLLSGRAETLAEEEKLLDLSMALVRALQHDAQDAFADNTELSRFLEGASAHL